MDTFPVSVVFAVDFTATDSAIAVVFLHHLLLHRLSDIFCQGIDHGNHLIISEIVDLECLGRTNSAAYAAARTLDFIVTNLAVFINKWRVKGTHPETGKAGHAKIPVVF
jgi:hypothetical protein